MTIAVTISPVVSLEVTNEPTRNPKQYLGAVTCPESLQGTGNPPLKLL